MLGKNHQTEVGQASDEGTSLLPLQSQGSEWGQVSHNAQHITGCGANTGTALLDVGHWHLHTPPFLPCLLDALVALVGASCRSI